MNAPGRRSSLARQRYAEPLAQMMELVRAIRNLRRELNVPQGKRRAVVRFLPEGDAEKAFEANKAWFSKLAYASELQFLQDASRAPKISSSAASPLGTAYLPLGELIDLDKERQRLDKELQKVQSEIKRAEGKLNNAGFVSKAQAHVVEEERRKLEENRSLAGARGSAEGKIGMGAFPKHGHRRKKNDLTHTCRISARGG